MMKLIRLVLGKIILFLDAALKPKALTRDVIAQTKIDDETKNWQMFQLVTCPFCVKVRREMIRLSVTIPFRDVGNEPKAQTELMAGGKQDQVPCLMIPATTNEPARWMYESSDIIEFLQKKFQTS